MTAVPSGCPFASLALPHYPLNRADEAFRPAFQPVVEAKPPEQDLYFTIAFHDAENSTKHERVGKPLGIGSPGVGTPKIIA